MYSAEVMAYYNIICFLINECTGLSIIDKLNSCYDLAFQRRCNPYSQISLQQTIEGRR